MRKLFTIALAFAVGTAAFAQSKRVVSNPAALKSYKKVVRNYNSLSDNADASMLRLGTGQVNHQIPSYSIDAVTSQKVGEAGNAFTWAIEEQDQLDAVPSLNTVGIIFRNNNVANGGSSGQVRYALSQDGGATWDVNPTTGNTQIGVINPAQGASSTVRNRYPDMDLWADGSTLKMGWVTAITNGTGWVGRGAGTLTVGSTAGTFTVNDEGYDLTQPNMNTNYDLTSRVPGELWYSRMAFDGTNALDTIYIYKGLYNSTNMKVEWQLQQKLNPAFEANVDGTFNYTNGQIHFSPNGNIGWFTLIGDLVGGQDSVYTPIFAEYDNATQTFGTPYEVDINASPDIQDYAAHWVDDSTQLPVFRRATSAFTYDAIIDGKGNPHMFLSVVPTTGTTPYTLNFTTNTALYDLTKKGGNWQLIFIDSLDAGRLDLWLADGSGSGSDLDNIDPNFILSRSEDGSKIFYHWGDTDENTVGFDPVDPQNFSPNLKGRAYDTNTEMLTPIKNWTAGDQTWDGKAFIPKASEVALYDGQCVYTVPAALPFSPSANSIDVLEIHYLSDIQYNCNEFTETPAVSTIPDSVISVATAQVQSFKVYPNPATNVVSVSANLETSDNVTISIENMNGQVLSSRNLSNASVIAEQIDLSNLASGVYFVKVTTSKGVASSKLVVE